MRGRRPKPTELKILHGNPGKRALSQGEPDCDVVLPEPPEHLNEVAREEWGRVGRLLLQFRLVSELDRAALAAYCVCYARWVDAEQKVIRHGTIVLSPNKQFPMKSPYLTVAESALEQMRKLLVEFGLTPSARSRLTGTVTPARPVGVMTRDRSAGQRPPAAGA